MKETQSAVDLYLGNLALKTYLSDDEASAYTGMSRSAFRKWAREIGCRRKLPIGSRGRVLNIRAVIDKAIIEKGEK